jgi:hypothetical protein
MFAAVILLITPLNNVQASQHTHIPSTPHATENCCAVTVKPPSNICCIPDKVVPPSTPSPSIEPAKQSTKCFLPAIEDNNGKCFIPQSTPPVSPTACKETGSCFSPVHNNTNYKTLPLTQNGIVGGLIK